MSTAVEKPSGKEEEIRRALIAVAYCNGDTRQAEKMLAEDGIHWDHVTLWRWQTQQHSELYERLRAEVLPTITRIDDEKHRNLANRLMDAESEVLERVVEESKKIEARELPAALRNLGVTSAIHQDKAQLLEGLPTANVQHQDASSLLKKLKARGWEFEATEGEDGVHRVVSVAS
jgi:transposase-like protein